VVLKPDVGSESMLYFHLLLIIHPGISRFVRLGILPGHASHSVTV